MTAPNEGTQFQIHRHRPPAILNDLQTWWLVLIVCSVAMAIWLIVLSHRNAPDTLRLTLISLAAIFLIGILLSTISVERRARERDDPAIWLARLRCVIAMGIAALLGFAAAHTDKPPNPGAIIAAAGVLTAGAGWIAGLLLGFIFGLPHRSTRTRSTQDEHIAVRDPTGLEEIADWLTKLIVGAGLTQLTKIPGLLNSLAQYIGQAMGDQDMSDARAYKLLAIAICIFFPLCGFLYGYLWGRVIMPRRQDPPANERMLAEGSRESTSFVAHGI